MNWQDAIRTIPDFPEKGILFRDITTLLKNGEAFAAMIDEVAEKVRPMNPEVIVGPESRGFILGAAVAYHLKKGFIPVRKPGKLPAEVLSHEYALEYGTDVLEIHRDAIQKGQPIVVVDDLLATGGTAEATARMIEELGGVVAGFVFLIELTYLDGRDKLKGYPVETLLKYE
ncbi:MAG: adenine phosphoribosyltransferase [Negativicutes bacterium]|nr:adenine phosphoribosyltransferase [Negativicutes bacterium]